MSAKNDFRKLRFSAILRIWIVRILLNSVRMDYFIQVFLIKNKQGFQCQIEQDPHFQNQNEVLGMSSYSIETSARNLPYFGRKLIPKQLSAKIITVVI